MLDIDYFGKISINKTLNKRSTQEDVEILPGVIIQEKEKEEYRVGDREMPDNRTYYLNCSTEGIACGKISCLIGPFVGISRQNNAQLLLSMNLNVTSVSSK